MKRRAIEKEVLKQNQKQSLINQSFQTCKGNKFEIPKTQTKVKEFDQRKLNLHYQNGAQSKESPFRSLSRVSSLLKGSNYSTQYGSSKVIQTPTSLLEKVKQLNYDDSKPSSITSAMTKATTVYEYSQSQKESAMPLRKRDCKKQGKKAQQKDALCDIGKKRNAQLKIDQMEYFTRYDSKTYVKNTPHIRLTDKKTGATYDFRIYDQRLIKGFKNSSVVKGFDMTKLEVEYDYDTDAEQQRHSKRMLFNELSQAIDFYVRDEPIKLIENVTRTW